MFEQGFREERPSTNTVHEREFFKDFVAGFIDFSEVPGRFLKILKLWWR